MSASAELRLFGGFALRDSRGAPVALTLRKTEALIAYLAVGSSRSQHRERLACLLWSESQQARALQSLRQARLTLMRDLEAHDLPIVEFDRREIRLGEAPLKIDAVEFARLREADDPDSLEQAVDLYRGEFLAGLDVESDAFEEWLQPTRVWYREQVEAVLERLLLMQERAGAHESSIRTVKRILAMDPLREDMHRWLMRAFVAAGHRTSALAAYDACRAVLREELGVSPEAETDDLYRSILHRAQPNPPAGGATAMNLLQPTPDQPIGGAAAISISSLSNAAREVLRIAAICGDHFSLRLLEGMNETPGGSHAAAIQELRRAGLLQWDETTQTGEVAEAVRNKITAQLFASHRKHLHYSAALTLETLAHPDSHGDCYAIARHYREADQWQAAARHQLRLVRLEFEQGSPRSAEPLLEKAQSDIAMMAPGEARAQLEVEARLIACGLAEVVGEIDRTEAMLDELWPTLKPLAPSRVWAAALLARSRLHCRRGRVGKAYAAIRLIPQKCDGVPNESLWFLVERFADAADVISGEAAAAPAQRLRQFGLGPRSGKIERALLQALGHAKQNRYAAAYTACDQAMRTAEELQDPTCLIVTLQTLGMIQAWDGDAAAALEALERAQDLALQRGDLLRQYTALGYRGFALISAGRSEEGREQLTRALEMGREMNLQFMAAMFSAWLAEAHVDSGDYEAALDMARSAAGLANERNELWARSVALRVLGQALARSASEGAKLVDRILRSAQEMQSSLGLTFESERTAGARAQVSRTLH